jgi:hypothetical protein
MFHEIMLHTNESIFSFIAHTLIHRDIDDVFQILQRAVLGRDQTVAAVDAVEEDDVLFDRVVVLYDDCVFHARIHDRGKHNSVFPHACPEESERGGFLETEPLDTQFFHLHCLCVRQLFGVTPALHCLEDQVVLGAGGIGRKSDAG